MFNRNFIYDFGVSQDDPKSELSALTLQENDHVLCIASAGEVPLELLVHSPESVIVDAVDIAPSQLFLSRLKLRAALVLDTISAARFLGYMPAKDSERVSWFKQIDPEFSKAERNFWKKYPSILALGPVNLGKYETYIRKFSPLGRWLLGGKKRLEGLFETTSVEEQKTYFDDVLRAGLLKNLFKVMFHPKLYKQRGISEQGLIHWQDQQLGLKFYHQFRDFCTNTPVRNNWMLQFVLFNRVLFEESLPSYLQQADKSLFREMAKRIRFAEQSITGIIEESDSGYYNKFALSNVSDWLSDVDFTALLQLIAQKSGPNARGLIRYIHSADVTAPSLQKILGFDRESGEKLLLKDRFPFYKLIPFSVDHHAKN